MAIRTTCIETSRLLKENGFRQDGQYYHFSIHRWETKVVNENGRTRTVAIPGDVMRWEVGTGDDEVYYDQLDKDGKISASTTDELLDELPSDIEITKVNNKFYVYKYVPLEQTLQHTTSGEELTEALAAMWLWLRKEKLL